MSALSPQKVLVVRFSALGDVILVTGALDALKTRFPQAKIHCVVREDCAAVLTGQRYVDRLWILPRKAGLRGLWALGKKLRAEKFDVLYDAHRSLRSRLLIPLVKAAWVLRFPKNYWRRFWYLRWRLRTMRRVLPFREAHVAALKPLDVPSPQPTRLEVQKNARQSLRAQFPLFSGSGKRLAVAPSAAWPLKRWPLPHFRVVIESLMASNPELSVIVLAGPNDQFCAPLVAGLPAHRVANLQGKLSLPESFAALAECDGLLANDTGLAHAAEALGKPAVFLFGPTTPEIGVQPQHRHSRVAQKQLWCRPCSKHGKGGCWRGDHACLQDLHPRDVLPLVRTMLEEAP